MDKRSKVEGSDKSTNGRNTKEAALDKLRQMEWMRNKQDTWHLARADSRKQEGYVKKKYNKDDEDSYFEGTGSQKSKKVRKPRQADTTRAPADMVPTGFVKAINSAPPPVNAWAQKKGSALFNKPPEEVDEDDEMLKLALQESLKTAEEDKRRQMERMNMAMGEAPTFHSTEPPRNDWKGEEDQYSEVQDQYSPSPATNRDLQFIESDSEDETPPPPSQRRKPPQSRNRKSSNPNEKPPSVNMNNTKPHRGHDKTPSLTTVNDLDNSFESSRPNRVCSAMGKPNYDQIEPPVLDEHEVLANKESCPQEVTKGKSTMTSVNDLSIDFSSSLTFGDTQHLKESNYDNYNHISQDRGNSYRFESKPYEPSEPNRSIPIMVPTSTSPVDKSGFPENVDDTDRIIHSFFRHDPPSTLDKQDSLEFYAKHNPQLYFQNDPRTLEQNQLVLNGLVHDNSHSVLKNNSGQDLRQSESNSPLQNVSPYGSFGKETLAGLPQNVQQMLPPFPLPYPINVQNNQEVSSLHAMQLAASRNAASHMPYGISPGYPFLHQTIGGIPPGLNQFGYPNSNVLVPPNLRNLTPQQLTMNAFQHQQAQLTMETIQPEPNILQNQPQMMSPGELQAQMTLSQSHLQMLQQARLQTHSPVNQLIGNTGPKSGELAHEANQISPEQGIQQPTNKSREELQQQYVQTMQYLNQLSQQLANSSVQSVVPEHQLYNYPGTLPMPIGSNNNMLYSGVQMMTPSQPLATQQHTNPNMQPGFTTQPSQGSPNIQPGFPDLEAILNITPGVGPTQPSSHAAIGRGRGRIP